LVEIMEAFDVFVEVELAVELVVVDVVEDDN
jgi:hypothetical protein